MHLPVHERNTARAHALVEHRMQLGRFVGTDDRSEIQLRVWIGGVLHGERVSEFHALHDGQVHLKELCEHGTLHDETRIGGAPLLAVFESLLDVRTEKIPLRESPDAPDIETLLLQEVPATGVRQGRRGLAAVGATTHERQTADSVTADQDVAQGGTLSGHQGHRQSFARHERVGEGQAVEAALAGGFRDDRVAGEHLHEFGMHLHAHRVVPRCDVAHRARQRLASR